MIDFVSVICVTISDGKGEKCEHRSTETKDISEIKMTLFSGSLCSGITGDCPGMVSFRFHTNIVFS